jgi:hypothetical protein
MKFGEPVTSNPLFSFQEVSSIALKIMYVESQVFTDLRGIWLLQRFLQIMS